MKKSLILLLSLCVVALLATGCGKKTVEPYPAPGAKRTVPTKPKKHLGTPVPAVPGKKTGKVPATARPYTVMGETYHPYVTGDGYEQEGYASWYGGKFHGRRTANGEIYDMYKLTAAHRLLPLPTKVRVVNLENGKSVVVRVNDRGPFVDTHKRIIDLSRGAAARLDMLDKGVARVRIETIGEVRGLTKAGELTGQFYIQVGAFTRKSNAEALAQTLRDRGYGGTRLERVMISGTVFWRVQAGVYSSLSKAEAALPKLEKEFPNAFVLARN